MRKINPTLTQSYLMAEYLQRIDGSSSSRALTCTKPDQDCASINPLAHLAQPAAAVAAACSRTERIGKLSRKSYFAAACFLFASARRSVFFRRLARFLALS